MHPLLAAKFTVEMKELWFQLKQPHYLEQLLRPVFVWGVGLAAILWIAAFFMKDAKLRLVTLVALAATCLMVLPYAGVRKQAVAKAAGRTVPKASVQKLREETRWAYFAVAGLAVGTLIWGAKGRMGQVITISSLVGGVAVTMLGIWLDAHDAGAMHSAPKSRAAPPPKPSAAKPAATTTKPAPRADNAAPVRRAEPPN